MTILNNTDLYCITDSRHANGRDTIAVVSAMIAAGVTLIQYREKDKSMREKYLECLKIRQMTRQAGVTFIVNDHVDLAMLTHADGIHIGQDDLPVSEVRKLVGPDKIIGLSTHAPDQADRAAQEGVDYIGAGPVFKTMTKDDVCDPVGLDYIRYVAGKSRLPFVAIGGIKEDNCADVVQCGATCIAMVTEVTMAENITNKIKSIKQTLKKAIEG